MGIWTKGEKIDRMAILAKTQKWYEGKSEMGGAATTTPPPTTLAPPQALRCALHEFSCFK